MLNSANVLFLHGLVTFVRLSVIVAYISPLDHEAPRNTKFSDFPSVRLAYELGSNFSNCVRIA
jgi:hypothetical protein